MRRQRLALDVDGVVANLIGGMRKFTVKEFGVDFAVSDIVYHDRMGRSPRLSEVHETLKRWFPETADAEYYGFGGAFRCFMKDRDVYGQWVDPIEGSVDAVSALREEYDIAFVTALMKSARDHFRSKMEWIERWFPGIPIITSPSAQKCWVQADHAVDDRYDTCFRWWERGTNAMLFRQSWNEIPSHSPCATWDWAQIKERLL